MTSFPRVRDWVNDVDRDALDEWKWQQCVQGKSLIAPLTNNTASNKRDLEIPSSDTHAYKTIREIGEYLSDSDREYGIDYVSLSFSFRDFVVDNPKDWEHGSNDFSVRQESGHWRNTFSLPIRETGELPKVKFWAHVQGTRRTAGFEINPSTALFGSKSAFIAPLTGTRRVMEYIYESIIPQWLVLEDPLDMAKLTRLDVSVDVENVLDIQQLLRLVSANPPNSRLKTFAVIGPRNRWETTYARSKSNGGMSIYDKSRQLGLKEHTVRFESQMRPRALEKFCPTVKDLNETALKRIFNKNLGNAIAAMTAAQDNALDGLVGDQKTKLRLVEYAGIKLLANLGYHVELGSSRTAHYRKFDRMGVGDILAAALNGST